MRDTKRALTSAWLLTSLCIGALACAGESPESANEPAAKTLEERSTSVMASGERWIATPAGFGVDTAHAAATRAGFEMQLPKLGEGTIQFDKRGFKIGVVEVGARGAGRITQNAVQFTRDGGTSAWATLPNGYEEWIRVEHASMDAPVAEWHVEGADLRQEENLILVLNEEGAGVMTVSAPAAFGADGTPIEAKLTLEGDTIQVWADANGGPALVDPAWTNQGSMISPRDSFPTLLIPTSAPGGWGGSVLVSGGFNTAALTGVEAWSPLGGNWFGAASGIKQLTAGRYGHTMNISGQSGGILVAGGQPTTGNPLATAEFLSMDLTTNTAIASTMTVGRYLHTGTTNPGFPYDVVLIGGKDQTTNNGIATADSFGITHTFTKTTGSLATGRYNHTATVITVGGKAKILVAGGQVDLATPTASCEIYDFATTTFSAAAAMANPRYAHTATLLPSGKVLVAGGITTGLGNTLTAEIYDPATNTWAAATDINVPTSYGGAALLDNGAVVVAGGGNTGVPIVQTELYDPAGNTWTAAAFLNTPRWQFGSSITVDGSFLAAGGRSTAGTPISSSELFALNAQGTSCTTNSLCGSGFCSRDNTCCDQQCDSLCQACSTFNGAPTNGTCSTVVTCTALDQCHGVGTCDDTTGKCNNPALADMTACDADNNPCTQNDVCTAGVCTAGKLLTCTPPDQCHDVGACDDSTGTCPAASPKADGSTCDDGNACTLNDVCTSGTCTGGTPVTCQAMDECHVAGTCDPTSGCSNPNQMDGTPCTGGTCESGVCQSGAGGGGGSGTGGSGTGGNPTTTTTTTTSGHTSSAATTGAGGGSSGSGETAGSSGGCGCSVPGSSETNRLAWAVGLGLLMVARRRRNRSVRG